jgi:hypothetical protein
MLGAILTHLWLTEKVNLSTGVCSLTSHTVDSEESAETGEDLKELGRYGLAQCMCNILLPELRPIIPVDT